MRGTSLSPLLTLLLLTTTQLTAQPIILLDVYPDGWCTVRILANVTDPIMEVPLLGEPSLIAVLDEEGLPLNYTVEGETLVVDADAVDELNVSYETQSLTSKEGLVWTLNIARDVGIVAIRLLEKPDVVGLSDTPTSIREGPNYLELTMETPLTLEYVYTSRPGAEAAGHSIYLIALISLLIPVPLYLLIRGRRAGAKGEYRLDSTDLAILLSLEGGDMRLPDLREKLSLPKTTLWRRTRRLSEWGLLEIDKSPSGSIARLTKRGRDVLRKRRP